MEYKRELYHHGILGQKWGKKNGPPYPLGASSHSSSEKKAGWRKSLKKSSNIDTKSTKIYTSKETTKKEGLSPEQKKKLIKIGATVAVAGLAAYGSYKLYENGSFDSILKKGKYSSHDLLVGAVGETVLPESSKYVLSDKAHDYLKSISGSLEGANPHKDDPSYCNNCGPSALAGFCRDYLGHKNATAKSTGGEMLGSYDMLHECFDGIIEEGKDRNLLDLGNAIKLSKGPKDASEHILKRLKVEAGAEGVVAIDWKRRLPNGDIAGHIFSWKAIEGENGLEIVFKDYNTGHAGEDISYYFNNADPTLHSLIARIDNLKPKEDGLKKYVDGI